MKAVNPFTRIPRAMPVDKEWFGTSPHTRGERIRAHGLYPWGSRNNPGIIVEVVKLHPGVPLSLIGLKRTIRSVLKQEKVTNAQLTFVLASDYFLRRLNKKFTARDMDTDVLSFDLSCDIKNGVLFGDIVVSVDSAARVSKSLRISFKEELTRYLIHGILHLTGYDDTTAFKKEKMWKRQEELVKEV